MKYTKEHTDFLKKHGAIARKELCEKFNKKFSTALSCEAIKTKCTTMGLKCQNNGRFKKECVPFNKDKKGLTGRNRTSFKPGNIPLNKKEVGDISYRTDKKGKTYAWIKISEPNRWKMLHVYIWEQAHGEVPKGKCVIFKDKNSLNLKLENLMLVSRNELARLNKTYCDIHAELKTTALQIIKIKEKAKHVQQNHTAR